MKAGAEKSSTTTSPTATQQAKHPFFSRAGEGGFFAPATPEAAPAVQMKMVVSEPGDKLEQEADKMAGKVLRMPALPSPAQEEKLQRQGDDRLKRTALPEEKLKRVESPEEKIRRAEAPEEKIRKAESPEEKIRRVESPEEKIRKAATSGEKIERGAKPEERLQRKEGKGTPAVTPAVQSGIREKMTGGEPLASDMRSYMEPRLGAEFDKVRVHRDEDAASLSEQLAARAFTYQNHVFFGEDQYQPDSDEGKQLFAHELIHTMQQGHALKRKEGRSAERRDEVVQKAPARKKGGAKKGAAAKPAIMSSEVVDLSTGIFNPSEKVKEEIAAQRHKGLDVRVIVKGVTGEGVVKVRADRKKNFDSMGKPGSMPLLNPWAQEIGGMYINFKIVNNEIKGGFASLKPGGWDPNDWLQPLKKNAALLGGLGLKIEKIPKPVNKFEGGKLTIGVSGIKVEVAGVVDAEFNFALENADKPKIEASAAVAVPGMAKGELKLDNTKERLAGQLMLAVEFKSFSGMALVKYNPDGTVDIRGKAAYNADRLSGEIEVIATDLETANSFAKDAIAAAGGKEKVQEAPPPAPVPAPKEGKKKRGLAATGQLTFNLTNWFAGTVFVVMDGKGHITVIGKIAPPGEIELFKQKDWDKTIVEFEAKAYYGIPVIGNLNLFANISLHAIAKLGPAKLYKIEILGTYSTDPEVQKFIQISGSINVSAYGGLKLRAEGGAGVELARHNLKFGIGLEADVGVMAYAEARPTIGYRDPGVFYISGTLDIVAQPMLGLGGDFFIALKTPWWSPLSDDRWTWPLFKKEWPLGDPIGIAAAVKEYELGSKKVPEIELKKPEFDPTKMMTKMVDDELPDKSGKKGAGQGSFKEDGTVKKPEIPPKQPEPKKPEKPKKGAQPKAGKSAKPDPKGVKDQETAKIFENAAKPLAALKDKGPLNRNQLNEQLAKIKKQVKGVDFVVQVRGEKWYVAAKAGGKVGKGIEIAGKDMALEAGKPDGAVKPDGVKPEERTPTQKQADLNAALKEINIIIVEEARRSELADDLPRIKKKYGLTRVQIKVDQTEPGEVFFHVDLEINPIAKSTVVGEMDYIHPAIVVDPPFFCKKSLNKVEFAHQLNLQEVAINKMKVHTWLANRNKFVREGRSEEGTKLQKQIREDAYDKFRATVETDRRLVYQTQLGLTITDATKKAEGFANKLLAFTMSNDGRMRFKNSQLTDTVDGKVIINELYKKAAYHTLDQVAGGSGTDIAGLGGEREDYSLGAQWRGARVEGLEKKVKKEVKGKKADELKNIRMNVKLPADYET